MKRVFSLLGWSVLVATLASAAEAPSSRAVLPPSRRIEALKLADRVLATPQPNWQAITTDLPDPFFRKSSAPPPTEVVDVVPQSTRSTLDVLQQAAGNFRPTGIMMVDGENYLLMDGKRYKAGAVLPVTIDETVYHISITAIAGKSYSLRLQDQELRQQLK